MSEAAERRLAGPPSEDWRWAAGPAAPAGHVAAAVAAMMLAVFLAGLGQTIVATALPAIAGGLRGPGQAPWVVTAYLLAFAVGLPVCARLGDRLGRKRLFVAAVVVFLAGSALAGASRNIDELIAFRAVQGGGAGGLVISAWAIVGDVAPLRERGRLTGLIGAVFGVAVVAGPLLGGYLADDAGWRWVFYLNVPVGALALAVVVAALRLPRRARGARLDLPGMALLAGASTCAVLVAAWAGTRHAWGSPVVVGLGAGFLALAAAFTLAERAAGQPVAPLRLLRSAPFVVSGLIGLLTGAATFGPVVYLPTFLQLAGHVSAATSGLLMLPFAGGAVAAGVGSGRMAAAGQGKVLAVAGTATAAVGLVLLSRITPASTGVEDGISLAVLGTGLGLVLRVPVRVAQRSAAPEDLGVATAASGYLHQIGGSLGSAVVGSLLAARLAAGIGSLLAPRARPPVFLYLAAALAAGVLLSLLLRRQQLRVSPGGQAASAPPAPGRWPSREAAGAADRPQPPRVPGGPGGPAEPGGPGAGEQPAVRVPAPAGPLGDTPHVRGHVLLAGGAPVSGATVTLIDASGRQAGLRRTGPDGSFHIPADRPARYTLIVLADGQDPHICAVQAGRLPDEHQVTLAGSGGVAGIVRMAGPGTPLAGATVALLGCGGDVVAGRVTDEEGRYRFESVAPGRRVLAVSAPSHQPAAFGVVIRAGVVADRDVELGVRARLEGTARTAAGVAVPDARVRLLDRDGKAVAVTTTGPDGSYAFDNLSRGEYTVVASGYPPVASRLTIDSGEPHRHEVTLGHPRG